MKVIIGLGNPGKEYERTPHNLGFLALEHFAKTNGVEFTKNKYYAKVAEMHKFGEKVLLLKPQTFMNLSGKSVEDIVHSLKLNLDDVLILVDDIDLGFGSLRLRSKGSAGTHNGLRDIVRRIGENFSRVRIGAGKPEFMDLATYVTSRMDNEKFESLNSTFEKIDKVIDLFIEKNTLEGIDINKL